MLRFYFIIIVSIFAIFYFYLSFYIMEKHPDKFSEQQRYELAQFACRTVQRNGRIKDTVYGLENLPEEGGYLMYSNHQGRYDALGIFIAHKKPCSFVVDKERSKVTILNQITILTDAKRLDKNDIKNQVTVIQEVADEVAHGRKILIFPEGGYGPHVTDNEVHEFMPGSFKAALKAKRPIVPIALVDSYKVFEKHSLRKVYTETHFLKAIPYEEFKDMNTIELSQEVRRRIEDKIKEVLANR